MTVYATPVLLVAVALLSAASTLYGQADDAVQTLFDGRSLDGWEGDLKHWRVEEGAILGEIPPGQTLNKNTWLVWRGGTLKDFDLRLQFQLSGAPAANSGVQVRCQVKNVDHVSGYQADLDMGATWLGRIYDEHGRGLLVERGTRILVAPDGSRRRKIFAPAEQYAVLFRENDWNDYRIVGIGDRIAVYVNGTLFSDLRDEQTGERDLEGSLALQLHSGPETRVRFRNITLETLTPGDDRLPPFFSPAQEPAPKPEPGVIPKGDDSEPLNMGFETGTLKHWTATGDAFDGQPLARDGIASRWAGQQSNKVGEFFIGGYEVVQDRGTGTLTSESFTVTHPYASFLLNGGNSPATRIDIVRPAEGERPEEVIFTATGDQREQMRRVVADLKKVQGERIAVRIVDESRGGWGHLNFDDFRFHAQPPAGVEAAGTQRSTRNPLLQHLVPNRASADPAAPGASTVQQMFVPRGFSVNVVAAEPRLHQPMAFTFDARGRLWVVEGHSYPQKRPEGEGLDRILIFSDDDADGTFENRKVFAEGLNLVSGLEVGYGGVWVGAAPELLFIPDRDGDDRPDSKPQVLLDGFGYADTHETINSFVWGPDGWLYGNQGVFNVSLVGQPGAPQSERVRLQAGVWRYHPVRKSFEVFAHGGSNQWGLDFDDHGELFMTHCRSFWGGGPTTHVMPGGHYWNQVNSGYAPFISPQGLPERPHLQNFLRASARYGHGEGGAGKQGSREVYGGHSHVGTMIYLGDNWPAEHRNRLFTHNLHGHQINQQVNHREQGGYNTRHAGEDVLFCSDPQYIGVALKCGPDGAVYISDWYDPRHCHNPNAELWDRGNGRIYRMQYDATYKPARVDYSRAGDEELVSAQLHANDWHVRAARLVLAERAATGKLGATAADRLLELALTHEQAERRLRGAWALHCIDELDVELIRKLLADENEHVRGWAVRLGVEALDAAEIAPLLVRRASDESSLLVRRSLASALQRLPRDAGWNIAEALAAQPENADDRDLPLLLWCGLAALMEADLPRALQLADATPLPMLRDFIHWYAARGSPAGRDAMARRLAAASPEERFRLLTLMELAVRGMSGLPSPEGWSEVAERLYDDSQPEIRRAAESLGAAFGDEALFDRMRRALGDASGDINQQRHALTVLKQDDSPLNLPLYLKLLDSAELAPAAIPLLSRYSDPRIAPALLERYSRWEAGTAAAAMETLSGRAAWSHAVLDAIAAGRIPKSALTAYHARQMASLGDSRLNERLTQEWGRLGETSAELQSEIRKTAEAYRGAPLWAFSAPAGAAHFKQHCAACHEQKPGEKSLAPSLAGTGAKGIEYIVENVIDPNAVIGRDFQAQMILTHDGRVLSGLILSETDTAVTLRTATSEVTIPRDEIDEIRLSENSFMPAGLLNTLNDRERIELLKYLMSL